MNVQPIGVARTPFLDKASAPRQPAAAKGVRGSIELFPSSEIRDALSDLEGWSRIWVLFWFHLADGWRPKVLPPRGEGVRRGVFATRSPHRPNPIGMSALRLERVEDCVLHVLDVDLVDGTPVLDLKPYVSYTDAYDDAGGWLDDPKSAYEVTFSRRAEEALAWLCAREIDLRERIRSHLALGPQPHAYRRIRKLERGYVLAVKEWRVEFSAEERAIEVVSIRSGFRPTESAAPREGTTEALHRAFMEKFVAKE